MYPKYHILVLGLVLLGHSIQGKTYNEQTGQPAQSDNQQWYDDFYLDEQQDWPDDEWDSEGGSGIEGSGIEGSADGPMTMCMQVREQLREKHMGAYIPRCTEEGEFEALQCNYQTGECWCVTRNGDKIPNTVRRPPHKPSCDDRDEALPPHRRPPPETKPDESEEETDDSNSIDIDDSNDIGIDAPPDTGTGTNIPNKIDPLPEAEIIEADNSNGLSVSSPDKEPLKASGIWGEPGILAGIIGGAVVGLLCAVLLVMFIVYRMRKKDEGSYALDEPKRSPSHGYQKARDREFFA